MTFNFLLLASNPSPLSTVSMVVEGPTLIADSAVSVNLIAFLLTVMVRFFGLSVANNNDCSLLLVFTDELPFLLDTLLPLTWSEIFVPSLLELS